MRVLRHRAQAPTQPLLLHQCVQHLGLGDVLACGQTAQSAGNGGPTQANEARPSFGRDAHGGEGGGRERSPSSL